MAEEHDRRQYDRRGEDFNRGEVAARVKNLERWQKSQNGHIKEIRDDQKELKQWIMVLIAGVAVQAVFLLIGGGCP